MSNEEKITTLKFENIHSKVEMEFWNVKYNK
jgi:hypothetical protein